MSYYQNSKTALKEVAKYLKLNCKDDKPIVRQGINDITDAICKEGKLTEHQQNLLHNYAAKLHPK